VCLGCGPPHNAHATAVSLPHQDFTFCQKHLKQAFFDVIFFTHTHLMRCLSLMVNLIAVMTFYWCPVYIAASKEHLRRIQIIFMLLESAFRQLFFLKFSFKLVTFSKSYAIKEVIMPHRVEVWPGGVASERTRTQL